MQGEHPKRLLFPGQLEGDHVHEQGCRIRRARVCPEGRAELYKAER
jgi:hypothetical protein